jgi:hypothetical protein
VSWFGWFTLVVLLVGSVLSVFLTIKQYGAEKAMLREHRRRANQQFFSLQREAETPQLRFNGLQAIILMDEERASISETGHHYELTRYAANEAGEVFMFIYNPDGKPFFKHVEPRIARVVLKERYRELGRA